MASRTIYSPPPVGLLRFSGLLPALLALIPNGCVFDRWLRDQPPCVLPAQPTTADLVRHLNERSVQLVSWRSNDVRVVTRVGRSLPMKLSAFLAVESPRNFRLAASSLMGYEADFGSNAERFWFWMRRSAPKKIFYARHEDLAAVQQRMPIPFQPDWLVETLIIAPRDARQVQMVSEGSPAPVAHLVTTLSVSEEKVLQRHLWMDTCTGDVVKQELQDQAGNLVARAEFGDYREDSLSRLRMPHRIELYWPFQKVTMTLYIGHIEVNPAEFSAKTWQFPTYEGYAPFDLARDFMGETPHPQNGPNRRLPPRRSPALKNTPALPASSSVPERENRPPFAEERAAVRKSDLSGARFPHVGDTPGSPQQAGHVTLPAEPPPFPVAGTSRQRPREERLSSSGVPPFSPLPPAGTTTKNDRPPFADE